MKIIWNMQDLAEILNEVFWLFYNVRCYFNLIMADQRCFDVVY